MNEPEHMYLCLQIRWAWLQSFRGGRRQRRGWRGREETVLSNNSLFCFVCSSHEAETENHREQPGMKTKNTTYDHISEDASERH